MADVEIRGNVAALLHRVGQALRGRELVRIDARVIVHADEHLAALGHRRNARHRRDIRRRCDQRRAEGRRHLERALDLGVGKIVLDADVVSRQRDRGLGELIADAVESDRATRFRASAAVSSRGTPRGSMWSCHNSQLRSPSFCMPAIASVERAIAKAVALDADRDASTTVAFAKLRRDRSEAAATTPPNSRRLIAWPAAARTTAGLSASIRSPAPLPHSCSTPSAAR